MSAKSSAHAPKRFVVNSDGANIQGYLRVPPLATGKVPAIVMAIGFSGVKDGYLDLFAQRFADAGFATISFDFRGLGDSDGAPRQEIDPWAQIADYRNVITFAESVPQIDAGRIGVWGSSLSGGHALVLGAIEPRVRCVVAQVPQISGAEAVRRTFQPAQLAFLRNALNDDRKRRSQGAQPTMLPVVAKDATTPAVWTRADAYQFYFGAKEKFGTQWVNEVTLRSIENVQAYEPGSYIPRIAPTPLLMIVADGDDLTFTDLALQAYASAAEPRSLVRLPGGHFDIYEQGFEPAVGAAIDWYRQHLN
jgi:fermentation-respiration switch protein FrsA (DUF1100 family)